MVVNSFDRVLYDMAVNKCGYHKKVFYHRLYHKKRLEYDKEHLFASHVHPYTSLRLKLHREDIWDLSDSCESQGGDNYVPENKGMDKEVEVCHI